MESSSSGGIGLSTVLGIVFLVLKLTGVIAWPWIWVLAPFWIPAAFVLMVVAVVLFAAFTVVLFGRS